MKMQLQTLLSEISKTDIEKLTNQVKETLAPGLVLNRTKTFSSADLWNIQRRRRAIVIR
ncbi:MAG: hypothetical protein H7258_01605 [Ferruginibacter sp.]|nr:hypothetical protein [Ferruginibacter sp.]